MANRVNIKFVAVAVLIAAAMIPFFYLAYVYVETREIIMSVSDARPNLSTKIFDINGELISELFAENRTYSRIEEIPGSVIKSFLFAEDQNFYRHTGLDIKGIFRAAAVDAITGDAAQGGSTITQQLAKQLYTRREKSFKRKIVELFMARELERRFSKDKILEMYLNRIYFGHGIYGVSSASRFFLEKDMKNLSLSEASLLASIQSAPNRYSPLKNPGNTYAKHRQLYLNIIASGHGGSASDMRAFDLFWRTYLDSVRLRFATHTARSEGSDRAPHFTEHIRKLLISSYGEDAVYKGGLSVYTTLDLKMQRSAEKHLREKLAEQNKISSGYNRYKTGGIDRMIGMRMKSGGRLKNIDIGGYVKAASVLRENISEPGLFFSYHFDMNGAEETFEKYLGDYDQMGTGARVEGAMVAISPKTGAILVMVGGGDFGADNQLNRAVQSRRQPGSAYKPFVYAAGVDTGRITAGTKFIDLPVFYKDSKKTWTPSNYEKSYRGDILARSALASSLNIVSVLIYEKAGSDTIASFSRKFFGLPASRFKIDPSLALGTSEVTPLELARGYSVFANDGMDVKPYSIEKIVDDSGRVIYDGRGVREKDKPGRVISKETAFIMTSMMRDVVDRGTAYRAVRQNAGYSHPAAGKTGTNTEFRDAWFAGYTPDITAVVWIGCDSQKFTLGQGQSGSVVAAPVWGKFMKDVYADSRPTPFQKPPPSIKNLDICSKTGDLPSASCPVKNEYYIAGTEPEKVCDSDHRDAANIMNLMKRKETSLLEKEKKKLKNSIIIEDLEFRDEN